MRIFFIISFLLVSLAITAPILHSQSSASASVFSSIQEELTLILKKVLQLQKDLDTLMIPQPVPPSEPHILSSAILYPKFEHVPLITHDLQEGLAVLYTFSVTADLETPTTLDAFIFMLEKQDISLRRLVLHAFVDEDFSETAFASKSISTFDASLDDAFQIIPMSFNVIGDSSIIIPPGETYYFKLLGTTSGKNVSAKIIIRLEGLTEETLQ